MEHSGGNRSWHPCHRKSCSLHSQTSWDFATSLAKALPNPPSSLPRLLLQHWFSLITPGFHRVLLRPKVGSSAEAQPWTPCTGRAEVLMGACLSCSTHPCSPPESLCSALPTSMSSVRCTRHLTAGHPGLISVGKAGARHLLG